MSKLTEKVALVTGGSRGISAAIAKPLAADGASVAITYAKDACAASAVVKAIERNGGQAAAVQTNSTPVQASKRARGRLAPPYAPPVPDFNTTSPATPQP